MIPMPLRRLALTLLSLALAAPLAACQDSDLHVERGIEYGRADDRPLRLDLVRPTNEGPFPAVVCIHGGGWRAGHRRQMFAEAERQARRGYVAVTVSYRLTAAGIGKARDPWPAQIEDVKCAVRWLRAHAAQHRLDPDRIAALGVSAGAHLSLLLGLMDDDDGFQGDGGHPEQSSKVAAVVSLAGPTELVRGHADTNRGGVSLIERLLGGPPEGDRLADYRAASPLTYVDADDPPVLMIHGDADDLVPYSQVGLLDEALEEAGIEHEVLTLEGEGHGVGAANIPRIIAAVDGFLDRHLKPTARATQDGGDQDGDDR